MSRDEPYVRPATLPEALDALANADSDVLAGGTDLVLMRQAPGARRGRLVDVKRVPELHGLELHDGAASIGACARLDELARGSANAVTDGAALVGGWQTRTRATIGGNVCRASPSADTLCGLLVHDAELELMSLAGRRTLPLREFLIGPDLTTIQRAELLVRVRLPNVRGGSAYARFTVRRAMDLAIAGVAVRVVIEHGVCIDASVAVGACGPTAFVVPEVAHELIGSPLDDATVAVAGEAIAAAARPIDDVRGSGASRRRVLPSLLRQSVGVARARALASAGVHP